MSNVVIGNSMEIDFVVTWVDMDDPKWQEEFVKYSGKKEYQEWSVTGTFQGLWLSKVLVQGNREVCPLGKENTFCYQRAEA